MKTHWLFGNGPNKEVHFIKEIDEETDCVKCIHLKVCNKEMFYRCVNYEFGTSEYKECQSCIHKYTRWDKDSIPCFYCTDFIEKPKEE